MLYNNVPKLPFIPLALTIRDFIYSMQADKTQPDRKMYDFGKRSVKKNARWAYFGEP